MAAVVEYWKREGLMYVSRMHISTPSCHGTITRTLDFISYHLILVFHGEKRLREMASEYNPMGDR